MDNKHKHLDLIQDVVNRMAQHSFVLKGWSITLVVAVFALNVRNGLDKDYVLVAALPVLSFWLLDGYYLQRERLFRALYDEVRVKEDIEVDYSMETKRFRKGALTLTSVLLSKTLIAFYPALLVLIFITYTIG